MEEENHERQQTELSILKDALEMIADMEDADKKKVYVLAKKDWHHGVIGIVCVTYCRPLLQASNLNFIKGQHRQGLGAQRQGVNLFDALTHCSDLLLKYGGMSLPPG